MSFYVFRTLHIRGIMAFNRELSKFRRWFLNEGPRFGDIPWHNAVTDIHGIAAIQWFRKPPFQVQMFVIPDFYVIPEHTHPNVDSIEMSLGGKFLPSVGGRWVHSPELTAIAEAGEINPYQGQVAWVPSDMIHGAVIGEGGGAFMSIQHWKNGVVPHCVSRDYDGKALASGHTTETGDLVHLDRLTWKDAASLEDKPPIWWRI